MTTFTTGTIRKNSTRKIAALLDQATDISFSSYSFSVYSDCYVYSDEMKKDVAFVVEWMKENYSDLSVLLVANEDGSPRELYIRAFGGTFTITFAPVEVKPSVTLDQVTEALEAGYVSPLNNAEKREVSNVVEFPAKAKEVVDADKDIATITVNMSEARILEKHEGETLAVDDYELLSDAVAYKSNLGEGEGYDKVFVDVILKDGRRFKFRHDITLRNKSIKAEWSKWVDYVREGKQA